MSVITVARSILSPSNLSIADKLYRGNPNPFLLSLPEHISIWVSKRVDFENLSEWAIVPHPIKFSFGDKSNKIIVSGTRDDPSWRLCAFYRLMSDASMPIEATASLNTAEEIKNLIKADHITYIDAFEALSKFPKIWYKKSRGVKDRISLINKYGVHKYAHYVASLNVCFQIEHLLGIPHHIDIEMPVRGRALGAGTAINMSNYIDILEGLIGRHLNG